MAVLYKIGSWLWMQITEEYYKNHKKLVILKSMTLHTVNKQTVLWAISVVMPWGLYWYHQSMVSTCMYICIFMYRVYVHLIVMYCVCPSSCIVYVCSSSCIMCICSSHLHFLCICSSCIICVCLSSCIVCMFIFMYSVYVYLHVLYICLPSSIVCVYSSFICHLKLRTVWNYIYPL